MDWNNAIERNREALLGDAAARLATAASARYFAPIIKLEKLEREIEALPPRDM